MTRILELQITAYTSQPENGDELQECSPDSTGWAVSRSQAALTGERAGCKQITDKWDRTGCEQIIGSFSWHMDTSPQCEHTTKNYPKKKAEQKTCIASEKKSPVAVEEYATCYTSYQEYATCYTSYQLIPNSHHPTQMMTWQCLFVHNSSACSKTSWPTVVSL